MERAVDIRACVEEKTRTRPFVVTWIGLSLYWLATPLKTTKSAAGAAAFAFV